MENGEENKVMTNDLERMASYVEKHRKLILDTERFIWKILGSKTEGTEAAEKCGSS